MRTKVWCALAVAAVLWAGQAQAAPCDLACTIDAPLGFSAGGAAGSIDPVDPLFINNGLDAGDTVCLAGSCDILSQDWIVFTVSVSSGSVNDVGLGLLSQPGLGMGYFLQGSPVQDGTGLADTYTGSLAVDTTPTFTFLANGGGAGLTGSSLVLFVAYADGTLPQTPPVPFNVFGDGAVQFMVTEYGTASVSSQTGNFTTPIEVVPEPGTAALLGLGLLALAAHTRKRVA